MAKKQTKATKGSKKAATAVAAPPKATRAPKAPKQDAAPAPAAPAAKPRDPRLPAAGTTMIRKYKGAEYRVEVREDGFRYEGREFKSLSALAAEITGAKSINGFFWFSLTPKRVAKKGPTVRDGSANAGAID